MECLIFIIYTRRLHEGVIFIMLKILKSSTNQHLINRSDESVYETILKSYHLLIKRLQEERFSIQ